MPVVAVDIMDVVEELLAIIKMERVVEADMGMEDLMRMLAV